jgi:hypothetical protein
MDLSNFFPAAPSYLPGLLGEEQARLAQQQAQQQGLLGAALGLMQAGAPSRTPISTGQALAQGLAAGQQAYGNVLQQRTQESLINRQLQEEQRKKQEQEFMRQLLPLAVQPGEVGSQALAQAAAAMTPDNYAKFVGAIKTQREMVQGPKPELRELGGALYEISSGQPPKLIIDAKGKLSGDFANYAKGMFGTDVVAELPAGGFEQIQNAIIQQKRAGATVVDMTGGQKGFENETKLRTEFQGSPEYKAFGEMKSAYGQVLEGLKKANAIGDLAAATKIMKLLDPGSVVRESELALAMQAGGLLDRVSNYATNIMQGTKLSPDQRREFSSLANSLFSVSLDAFNEKRGQYSNLAKEYGFDTNRVIGAQPSIPGLQKPQETPTLSLQQQAAQILEQRRKQRGQ